jgi:hypothetical protein
MYYLIAYPHPTVSPAERIERLELDAETDGKTLLGLLRDVYPDHSGDLTVKGTTLRKVSRPSVAQLPHWPGLQTTGLGSAAVADDSLQQVYDWIRNDNPVIVMPSYETLALIFPEGPHKASEREIDIVVVTPESASQS